MIKPNWLPTILVKRPRYLSDRNFVLILSLFIGLIAGLLAYALKTGVFYLQNLFLYGLDFEQHKLILLGLPLLGISLTVIFTRLILKDKEKHNITSILYSISRRNSLMKFHKIFSSVTGAIFTVGLGGSAGLESPIISSGSALGSNLGRILKLDSKEITLLLACGSSAAVSAIFNTPIAGIVFAIEVLLIDMNRFSLIPLLVASLSGTLVTHLLYREGIMFNAIDFEPFHLSYFPYYIVFAILMAAASMYFTSVFFKVEAWFDKMQNPIRKILIGGIVLGIALFFFPALFGEGYLALKQIFSGNQSALYELSPLNSFVGNRIWLSLAFILILALLKVVATSITMSAGGIGGIFAPSVFTGGLLGFVFASAINIFYGEPVVSVPGFVLVGMAGCLTGVLHAPLTGIFLIAEVTQSYSLIVPLMIVTTITFIVVKAFMPHSIITKQLAEKGNLITHDKDKAVLALMDIKKVIESNIHTVSYDAMLGELVDIIAKSHRNLFPVVDDNQNLKGIVYMEHIRSIIFEREYYDSVPVTDLMVNPPAIIDINDNMQIVIDTFNTTKAWNLPVLDGEKYIGVVSRSKLFGEYRTQLLKITEE